MIHNLGNDVRLLTVVHAPGRVAQPQRVDQQVIAQIEDVDLGSQYRLSPAIRFY